MDFLEGKGQNGDDVVGAIDILPLYPLETGRASKGVALALMGKTYLYMQDWPKAKEYFKKLIDLNIYSLTKPMGNDSIHYLYAYLSNFTYTDLIHPDGSIYKAENNSESIFEIQYALDEKISSLFLPLNGSNGHMYALANRIDGYRSTFVSKNFVKAFEPIGEEIEGLTHDPRKAASIFFNGDTLSYDFEITNWYYTVFNSGEMVPEGIDSEIAIRKYLFPMHYQLNAPFGDPTNIRLIRYADVLLMYAEACYHLNDLNEALTAINQVRERAGVSVYNNVNDINEGSIAHERMVELGLEGFRYFDLIRWSLLEDASAWPNPVYLLEGWEKGKHEYFPIPPSEISAMKGSLKQNPGW